MAGPIAKLYATLGLDAREFSEGVASAQSKAGTLSGAVGTGMRVAAGAMAAGLGFAAKGALEMENRMAQFQADTGASAEEAQRFGDELNAMAGRSLVAMDDIAGAMTAIRTDLGLTGDEAQAVAEDFERFMRATGQGSDAVLAFDDILDAWNLDAAKSAEVMDVLVKSHQTYGGSIEENQANLAKLAPALQAANIGFDEGQAFLNLFAASGIDGAAAATAFTKALGEVESPEELEQMLQTIMDMEDPFQRAQAAAELFGARGGAKIADALANAEGGLDSFKVTAVDAFGATEDAAAALDGTLSSQIQLAINHATSLLRGFGMELGPILTGAAAAANLATALLPPGALQKAWGAIGKSVLVQGAAGVAGGLAGAAYQAGAFVVSKFTTVLAAAWAALGAATSPVIAAATAAGVAAGGAWWLGVLKAIPVVGFAVLLKQFEDPEWKKVLPSRETLGLDLESLSKEYTRAELDTIFGKDQVDAYFRDGGPLADAPELINESATPIGAAVINQITGLVPAFGRAFAELDMATPIRGAFKLATDAVRDGFGSIKDALKNPPMLISNAQREENMAARLRQIMRNIREAAEANDDKTVRHWEAARAKQQAALDRLSGKTDLSMKDIRTTYRQAGVSVQGTWADTTTVITQESRKASDAGIAQIQRMKDTITNMNWVQTGTDLMTKLGIGFTNGTPALFAAADAAAAEARRRLTAPAITAPAATPVGASSGVVINGNVYGGKAGTRQLAGDIERATRPTNRYRRHNNLAEG